MNFKNTRVLVVGDIMLDEYIQGNSERISPEAPVPIVLVKENNSTLGGAANVANNCSSLGALVDLIGITGKDDAGKKIISHFKKSKINYLGPINKNAITTKKVRILSRSQHLLRVDHEKKTKFNFNTIVRLFNKVIEQTDIVIFSDYGKGMLDNIDILIKEAKIHNKIVCIDPVGQDYSKYALADYIKPNLKELKQVIGNWNDKKNMNLKIHKLMKKNDFKNLILTLSEEGSILFKLENERIKSKSFSVEKREVYDVTGAGDAFIAVFALMIANSLEINKAITFANKGAGSVVDKLGTYNINHSDLF